MQKNEQVGQVQKRLGKPLWKLKEKKWIGGEGRLTDSLIDRLQNYYGIAIQSNSGNLAAMKKATYANLFHFVSFADRNYQGQSPGTRPIAQMLSNNCADCFCPEIQGQILTGLFNIVPFVIMFYVCCMNLVMFWLNRLTGESQYHYWHNFSWTCFVCESCTNFTIGSHIIMCFGLFYCFFV